MILSILVLLSKWMKQNKFTAFLRIKDNYLIKQIFQNMLW